MVNLHPKLLINLGILVLKVEDKDYSNNMEKLTKDIVILNNTYCDVPAIDLNI